MPAKVLAMRLIPRVDQGLRERLKLGPEVRSLGLITCDSDDVGYTALAGEFLGILAGPAPDEVESGLAAAIHMIEHEASFYSANADDSVVYYAHCISRTGSYLSAQCGIPEGSPLAYLIAPPLESIYALDKALKAAQVRIVEFYGPPSPTNFGGGLLTGSQSDCRAACEAFARAVIDVAAHPIETMNN